MITLDFNKKNERLWQDYQQQKVANAMLFPTEGAQLLGVSELELMLANPHSTYIGSDFKAVLKDFEQFNKLESIMRNNNAVHEKLGQYTNLKLHKHMGMMINVGGLDIRYFVGTWRHMLAVSTTSHDSNNTEAHNTNADKPQVKASHSIQFYDGAGNAVNKVFLRDETQLSAWNKLIDNHRSAVIHDKDTADMAGTTTAVDTTIELEPLTKPREWTLKKLSDEHQEILNEKWLAMKDVHQFFDILKNLEIDRASSYHQAPDNMAIPLRTEGINELLHRVQRKECPIMIFVGNTGGIQIQTGTVKNIKRVGDWLNILDKAHNDFTLHLKEQAIAQLWCVKRPTKDGNVTCIEAFDSCGNTIVTFFGQRQEGQAERTAWLEITDSIMSDYSR